MSQKQTTEQVKPTKDIPTVDELIAKDDDKEKTDLRSLVEKNIKWSQVIYEQNRKIKHRLTMMVLGSYLRLLLILIPLLIGIIYLPPLFKQLWSQYSSILGAGGAGMAGGGVNLNDILSQVSGDQINQILKTLGR